MGLKEGQTLETNPGSGHPVTPRMEPQAALPARRKPGCSPGAVARLVLGDSRQQGDPSIRRGFILSNNGCDSLVGPDGRSRFAFQNTE